MKLSDTPSKKKTGRPLSFDRDEALRHAMLTFWRSGYETTSITELTSAMGVTAPSLYTAFGDKKRLFLEAMNLYAGSPDHLDVRLTEAATAYDATADMLTSAILAFTGPSTPPGCLLASAAASGSEAAADVREAVAKVRINIRDQVQFRIETDVANDVLPPDTDSLSLANMVIALIQGMSVLARDGMNRESLMQVARLAMKAWPQMR